MTSGTGEMEAHADDDTAVREPGGLLSSSQVWSPERSTPATRPGTVKPQLAAETLRLNAGDWTHFQDYCSERGMKVLPASADVGLPSSPSPVLAAPPWPGGWPPSTISTPTRSATARRRAAPRQTCTAAPTPATLSRSANTCRGDLAGLRDRALLLLLAAGLAPATIVALQAEHLRFTEQGLEMNTSRSGQSSRTHHLPRSMSPALCSVRAMEDWLRASNTRYGPVFRKVNRWGQLEHAALGADAILARRTAALPKGRTA